MSISDTARPAFCKTLRVASIGPVNIRVGSDPTVAKLTILALGLTPKRLTASADISNKTAAPSEI